MSGRDSSGLSLLPRTQLLVLDVGAGSGRDAAWFAGRGSVKEWPMTGVGRPPLASAFGTHGRAVFWMMGREASRETFGDVEAAEMSVPMPGLGTESLPFPLPAARVRLHAYH